MAIIYSYPIAQPLLSDLLLGTHIDPERPYDANPTKSFSMQDISNLISSEVTSGGYNGVFDTSDIVEVTVVNGIITNVVITG